MAERDILLKHAAAEVQGVLLAQLTAYAVNDNVEISLKCQVMALAELVCLAWGEACSVERLIRC